MNLLRRLLFVLDHDAAGVAVLAQSVLAFTVTRYHLTAGQTGAVDAAGVAALGLFAAAFTRPFHVQALTGFIAAAGTLMAAFSVHIPPGWVSAWSAAAALLLLVRERKATTTGAWVPRPAGPGSTPPAGDVR